MLESAIAEGLGSHGEPGGIERSEGAAGGLGRGNDVETDFNSHSRLFCAAYSLRDIFFIVVAVPILPTEIVFVEEELDIGNMNEGSSSGIEFEGGEGEPKEGLDIREGGGVGGGETRV